MTKVSFDFEFAIGAVVAHRESLAAWREKAEDRYDPGSPPRLIVLAYVVDVCIGGTQGWYTVRQAGEGGFSVEMRLAAFEIVAYPSAGELAAIRQAAAVKRAQVDEEEREAIRAMRAKAKEAKEAKEGDPS